jgi:hypothetical protein
MVNGLTSQLTTSVTINPFGRSPIFASASNNALLPEENVRGSSLLTHLGI